MEVGEGKCKKVVKVGNGECEKGRGCDRDIPERVSSSIRYGVQVEREGGKNGTYSIAKTNPE